MLGVEFAGRIFGLMRVAAIRRPVAGLAVVLTLAGCEHPDATVPVGTFSDSDTPLYLVLSDQLSWRRKVTHLEKYAGRIPKACIVVLPNGYRGGATTVDAEMLERLRDEQANLDIKFEIESSRECLAHYTRDDEPFVAVPSDFLAYAGYDPGGLCGDWIGGTSDGHDQEYRLKIDKGVAGLRGGHGCAGYNRWIRT